MLPACLPSWIDAWNKNQQINAAPSTPPLTALPCPAASCPPPQGLLAPTGSSNDIYHGGFNDGWSATASYKRTAWGRDDSWGPDSRQVSHSSLDLA